jgi:hypothetical protein
MGGLEGVGSMAGRAFDGFTRLGFDFFLRDKRHLLLGLRGRAQSPERVRQASQVSEEILVRWSGCTSAFARWLELEGRFGGFHLDIPVSSTRVTQGHEVGGLVRFRLPRGAFAEVGGMLYHVHLEEDPGEAREDALHLRHRAFFASLGVAF